MNNKECIELRDYIRGLPEDEQEEAIKELTDRLMNRYEALGDLTEIIAFTNATCHKVDPEIRINVRPYDSQA
jgi:adenylate kinase